MANGRSFLPAFWGKLARGSPEERPDAWLPLSDHCLDVACVFRRLATVPCIRTRLSSAAGITLSEGHLDRLSVLALLHDLGKTNLGFQNKPFDSHAPRAGHVRELALLLRQPLCDKLMLALNIEEMQPWFESAAELEPYLLAACGDRPSLGRLRSVA